MAVARPAGSRCRRVPGRVGRIRGSHRRRVGALSRRRSADRKSTAGNVRQRGGVVIRAWRRAPSAAGCGAARRHRRRRRPVRGRLEHDRRRQHGGLEHSQRAHARRLRPRRELSRAAERSRARRRGVVRQRHAEFTRLGARRCARARACARPRRRPATRRGVERVRSVGLRGGPHRQLAMSLRFLPNAISIGRAVLVAPLALWIVEGRYAAALLVLVVAGLSDGLDGFLAKRFAWRTRIGGLLDPAADKLLLVAAFASLTWIGLVPLPLTLVVIGRDVLIVLGAVCYQWLIAPV